MKDLYSQKNRIMQFSVLMSVYKNDKPDDFRIAVESISKYQTLTPNEIVIVVDGPVPDALEKTIKDLCTEIGSMKVLWQEKNQGLGKALEIGMAAVSNELVARMDADDISVPDRFEKQRAYMKVHSDCDVLGGQISEFIDSPDKIVAYRRVPLTTEGCKKYYQDRDPLNHMTVMFRRSAVMAVGNYQPWHLDEDSFLWGRLLKAGYHISNLPDILVNVRVGEQMYARRGGWKYFKSDTGLLKWKLKNNLTSYEKFIYNYITRFIIQVIMPNSMRSWLFKNLLRKSKI